MLSLLYRAVRRGDMTKKDADEQVMSVWLLFLLVLGGLVVWVACRAQVPQVPDPQG
jgi:hypothetical protein